MWNNTCKKGVVTTSMVNASFFVEDGRYCHLLVCEGNTTEDGTNVGIKNLHPITFMNTKKVIIKNNKLHGIGKTRESSERGSVIAAILFKRENSVFDVEYEITDNLISFDASKSPFVHKAFISTYTDNPSRSSNTTVTANIQGNEFLNKGTAISVFIDNNRESLVKYHVSSKKERRNEF